MIKYLIVALLIVFTVKATDLDNGRYELVHLRPVASAEHRFDLDMPRFHREHVHAVAVPHGCDSPINIYASVDKEPTSSSYDFASKGASIERTSWISANLTQSGHPKAERINFLIQAPKNPGQSCSVYFMAYASHTQALVVLENTVPQWGIFHIQEQHQTPHIHWFEFDLGKREDVGVHGLNFYVTSLNGDLKQEHYTYNVYVSGDNARPNPQNHQWGSLSLDDGDAFVQISSKDPKYKRTGKYYIAVVLAENPQASNAAAPAAVFYTVTPQIVKHKVQTKPILLLDGHSQVGASSHVDHVAYFVFYVDAERVNEPVRLEVAMRTGAVNIYVSSQTSNPNKNNHEYTSQGKTIEMVFKQAGFVHVAIHNVGDVVSTYDLTYQRV